MARETCILRTAETATTSSTGVILYYISKYLPMSVKFLWLLQEKQTKKWQHILISHLKELRYTHNFSQKNTPRKLVNIAPEKWWESLGFPWWFMGFTWDLLDEINSKRLWKMMVARRSFLFGCRVTFQGRTVKLCWGTVSIKFLRVHRIMIRCKCASSGKSFDGKFPYIKNTEWVVRHQRGRVSTILRARALPTEIEMWLPKKKIKF